MKSLNTLAWPWMACREWKYCDKTAPVGMPLCSSQLLRWSVSAIQVIRYSAVKVKDMGLYKLLYMFVCVCACNCLLCLGVSGVFCYHLTKESVPGRVQATYIYSSTVLEAFTIVLYSSNIVWNAMWIRSNVNVTRVSSYVRPTAWLFWFILTALMVTLPASAVWTRPQLVKPSSSVSGLKLQTATLHLPLVSVMHVKRSVFWPLYGFIVQYSWRNDRKQDGRDEERHAAKGNRPGLEPWAAATRTKPLQMGRSLHQPSHTAPWVPEADLRWESRENVPHMSIHFLINRLNNETVSDRIDVRQRSKRLMVIMG